MVQNNNPNKTETDIETEIINSYPDDYYSFYSQHVTECDADDSIIDALGVWK